LVVDHIVVVDHYCFVLDWLLIILLLLIIIIVWLLIILIHHLGCVVVDHNTMASVPSIPANSITTANFSDRVQLIRLHLMSSMGLAGKDVHDGSNQRKPKEVVKWTINSDGHKESSYELDPLVKTLTKFGADEFMFDKAQVALKLAEYEKQSREIIQLLVSKLSSDSVALLQTRDDADGGFVDILKRDDAVALWQLILQTHRQG